MIHMFSNTGFLGWLSGLGWLRNLPQSAKTAALFEQLSAELTECDWPRGAPRTRGAPITAVVS